MPKRKNLADKEKTMGTIVKVFVLHGWTYSTEKWQPFINLLKQKGMEAKILRIPGLTEDLDRVWTIEDYVSWLKKIIGSDKVILIGHSNGGRIVLAFTNSFPQKVEKLILIDSAGIYHNELPIRVKRIIFKAIAKIGKKLTSSKTFKNLFYKLTRESDYKDLDKNLKQTMVNLISADLRPILSKIQAPTLIIWGEHDTITPLSDGLIMNKFIKNSRLKIISDAKHSPQFTHPQKVAELISNNLTI